MWETVRSASMGLRMLRRTVWMNWHLLWSRHYIMYVVRQRSQCWHRTFRPKASSTKRVRRIAGHARPAVSCLTTIDLHHYRFLSYFARLLEACKGVGPVAKYLCTWVCHWNRVLPALLLRLPNLALKLFLIIKLFKCQFTLYHCDTA